MLATSRISVFQATILAYLLGAGSINSVSAQDFSPEMREKFIADQEAYYHELRLSDHQKRSYEEITRRYDKQFIAISQGNLGDGKKKGRERTLQKAKNKEMKALLSSSQYKRYLARQKEIANNYQ